MSECTFFGGFFGPSFSGLFDEQFYRLKAGDRVWYENGMYSPGI